MDDYFEYGNKYNDYHNLTKYMMVQVCPFNRRRAGEVNRLLLKTYTERRDAEIHSEVYDSLSPVEKDLVNKLTLIKTVGKLEKIVPIILTERMVENLNKLVLRPKYVPDTNTFFFANTSPTGHYEVHRLIRGLCYTSELEAPGNITTRTLRKHVGTISQLLMLQSEGRRGLGHLMTHTPNVHDGFYCLPEDTLMLAKTAKILFAMEDGVSKYAGMTLDQIHVNLDDVDLDEPLPEEVDVPDHEEGVEEDITCRRVEDDDLEVEDHSQFVTLQESEDEDVVPLPVTHGRKPARRPAKRQLSYNPKKGRRLDWSKEEIRKMEKLASQIDLSVNKTAPLCKIKDLMQNGVFKGKTPENVRNWLNLNRHGTYSAWSRHGSLPQYVCVCVSALFVTQCQARQVVLRVAEKCYTQIPVFLGKQQLFVDPATSILLSISEELPCHSPLLPLHFIPCCTMG